MIKKLLCKLFDHKWESELLFFEIMPVIIHSVCSRCGHTRADHKGYYISGIDFAKGESWSPPANHAMTKELSDRASLEKLDPLPEHLGEFNHENW